MSLVVLHNCRLYHHAVRRKVSFEIIKSEMTPNGNFLYQSILKFKSPKDVMSFVEELEYYVGDFKVCRRSQRLMGDGQLALMDHIRIREWNK